MIANASAPAYTDTVLASLANYSCDPFHRFSDGHTEKSIECTPEGAWQSIDRFCSSKFWP